jgi:hypothetical protein
VITYDDIKGLTLPQKLALLPAPGEEIEWWKKQGVQHDDLQRFCEEESLENYTQVLPQVLLDSYGIVAADEDGQLMAGAPLEVLPGVIVSLSAMSMEVGFLLGWLSYSLAMGKPQGEIAL